MPQVEFYRGAARIPAKGVRALTSPVISAEEAAAAVEWRWRFKADNGEIVATGEGHTRREDAERAFLHVAHLLAGMWALAEDEVDKTRVPAGDVAVWRWSA